MYRKKWIALIISGLLIFGHILSIIITLLRSPGSEIGVLGYIICLHSSRFYLSNLWKLFSALSLSISPNGFTKSLGKYIKFLFIKTNISFDWFTIYFRARAGPFIIGIILGYFLYHEISKKEDKIKIKPVIFPSFYFRIPKNDTINKWFF